MRQYGGRPSWAHCAESLWFRMRSSRIARTRWRHRSGGSIGTPHGWFGCYPACSLPPRNCLQNPLIVGALVRSEQDADAGDDPTQPRSSAMPRTATAHCEYPPNRASGCAATAFSTLAEHNSPSWRGSQPRPISLVGNPAGWFAIRTATESLRVRILEPMRGS